MPCFALIDDGTDSVTLDRSLIPALSIEFSDVEGGEATLRFLSGNAQKQTRWQKTRIAISGESKTPTGLRDLDYSQGNGANGSVTVTITRATDTPLVYTCVRDSMSLTWDYTTGKEVFSAVFEEA